MYVYVNVSVHGVNVEAGRQHGLENKREMRLSVCSAAPSPQSWQLVIGCQLKTLDFITCQSVTFTHTHLCCQVLVGQTP